MAEPKFEQHNPSENLNPSFRQEDQEMAQELAPMVVGPPAYASPDPKTTEGALVPVEQHPLATELSEDYGGGLAQVSEGFATTMSPDAVGGLSEDRAEWTKADWQTHATALGIGTSGSAKKIQERVEKFEAENDPDNWLAETWIEKVEAVKDNDELEALYAQYETSDADFTTVQTAFVSKEDELNPDEQ